MPTETTPSSSDPALATYNSPIGRLTLAAWGGSIVGVWVAGQRFFGRLYGINEVVAPSSVDLTSPDSRDSVCAEAKWDEADARALGAAASWLDDYVAGAAPSPAAVPLAPTGTDFQRRAYGQIVAQLLEAGVPASAQAVGGAVGRNPLLLIRPCHRVVAASGPGGYAAGTEAKAWLLAHEAATASSVS